jgi:hypothetical protein
MHLTEHFIFLLYNTFIKHRPAKNHSNKQSLKIKETIKGIHSIFYHKLYLSGNLSKEDKKVVVSG